MKRKSRFGERVVTESSSSAAAKDDEQTQPVKRLKNFDAASAAATAADLSAKLSSKVSNYFLYYV